MKIFKGKSFFFKSVLIHTFLAAVIAIVSVCFWEDSFNNVFIRKLTDNVPQNSQISLVMIDDESTDTYRWPWSRELYGEIFEYFNKYTNAKVVVFDALITSLDKYNPIEYDKYFFNTVKNSPNYIGGFMAQISPWEDFKQGELFDEKFQNKYSIQITDKRTKNTDETNPYKSISFMPDEYFNAVSYVGAVNLNLTSGNLYYSPDLIFYKGYYYPSLALSAYLLANNTNKLTVDDKYLYVDETGLKIPVKNRSGDLYHKIKFYKQAQNSTYSHKVYHAIDIINSNRALKQGKSPIIAPTEFDNKIIIVGGNSMNAQDTLPTAISHSQPGADIQATILENLINTDFMRELSDLQNLLIIIFMCIITFVIIRVLPFIPSIISLLCIGIIYFIFCILAFANDIAPLTVTPVAVQVSTMIFGYSYRFILEGKNKEKIKNAMGKYLSQDIMKNVVQNIDDIKLGGKKAVVTVLFSDIRGFTSMSENMTAEEVSYILNEYFSEMEPIITKYNGVINKFIGDAVMAIFGEPIQDINHAQNAVKCAYEMLKRVEYLREKWLFEGKPKIEIGIGINTGEAFVGNIGSEKRLEYTVIGDTVNLASRIEGYNKVYKTNLLVSSSTYSKVSDIVDVIKIADVKIRGKAKAMDIYEVLKVSK